MWLFKSIIRNIILCNFLLLPYFQAHTPPPRCWPTTTVQAERRADVQAVACANGVGDGPGVEVCPALIGAGTPCCAGDVGGTDGGVC